MNRYSNRSRAVYDELHPELQLLMRTVLPIHDHSLIHGYRTRELHEAYQREGVTQVAYSGTKHRFWPSLAVDAIPYIPGADPWARDQILFFVGVVRGVAALLYEQGMMQYRIRLGADWDNDMDVSLRDTSFFDGPHIELIGAEESAEDRSRDSVFV